MSPKNNGGGNRLEIASKTEREIVENLNASKK